MGSHHRRGTVAVMSNPAPAMLPVCSAWIRDGSSISLPLETLIRKAVGFIADSLQCIG